MAALPGPTHDRYSCIPAQVTGEHAWSYSDSRQKFTKLTAAAHLSSDRQPQDASAVGASYGLECSSSTYNEYKTVLRLPTCEIKQK